MIPGSKKSVALKCIISALKSVQDDLKLTASADDSIDSQTSLTTDGAGLYSLNESITTAKLADQLVTNDGVYLNLLDEIEGLFETLEGKSRDHLDRRLWLSLHTGSAVTRSTRRQSVVIDHTRLNYTGIFY